MSTLTRLLGFLSKYWQLTAAAIGSTVAVAGLNLGQRIAFDIRNSIFSAREDFEKNRFVHLMAGRSGLGSAHVRGRSASRMVLRESEV